MELKQLRYFIAVAQHLNFTEAAKELFVAQSAVSQQIAELEKEIGVKLFLRNKRSVRLTPAGSIFLNEAIDTVKKAKTAVQRARQTDSGLIGNISIGFINSAVRTFIPQIIRKFHRRFPDINLDLQQFNLAGITASVQNGEVDLGFTNSLGLSKLAGVVWEKIYTDKDMLVVPVEHPLAQETSIDIALLANERFIFMSRQESPEGFDHILKLCADHGFSPRIVSQPPLMETVVFLVDAGLGITITPECSRVYASPGLRFVDVEGAPGIDVGMMWKSSNSNPSLPILLQEIRKELAQYNFPE